HFGLWSVDEFGAQWTGCVASCLPRLLLLWHNLCYAWERLSWVYDSESVEPRCAPSSWRAVSDLVGRGSRCCMGAHCRAAYRRSQSLWPLSISRLAQRWEHDRLLPDRRP